MYMSQMATVETITMGNVTIPRKKAILLQALMTDSKYQTFGKNGVDYQVPAGKTLKILAIYMHNSRGDASPGIYLSYGDDAVHDSAAPPTTNVILAPGQSAGANIIIAGPAATATSVERALYFEVPAGKYPCGFAPTVGYGNNTTLLCIEE